MGASWALAGCASAPPPPKTFNQAFRRAEVDYATTEKRGTIVVDGEPHAFVPGSTAYLGRWVKHKIVNDDLQQPLKFTWTYLPPGLDQFFASIGRPRYAGEPTPQSFERPADVLGVEQRTGFGPPVDR